MEATLFLLLLLALFTAHHQHVVVERDLNILFLDAGGVKAWKQHGADRRGGERMPRWG